MSSRLTNLIRSGMAVMATFSTPSSSAVPALPGATYTFCTLAPCARRHASACSRPPEPITRIFMSLFPYETEKGEEGRDKGKSKGAPCHLPFPRQPFSLPNLMPEVAEAGKHHRYPMLVRRGDHFRVAHRAAGLDHRFRACRRQHINAVAEREEGVRCHDRTRQAQPRVLRLDAGDARTVYAAHLSRAHAQGLAVLAEYDGIGFHVFCHAPGEQQVLQLVAGGLRLGHHLELRSLYIERVRRLHQYCLLYTSDAADALLCV